MKTWAAMWFGFFLAAGRSMVKPFTAEELVGMGIGLCIVTCVLWIPQSRVKS